MTQDSVIKVNLFDYFEYEPHRLVFGKKPEVVCLCGSTRFYELFREMNLFLTIMGKIVLSIGAAVKQDEDSDFIGDVFDRPVEQVKGELDLLHLRKIDMCDTVLVLNRDLYVGTSTSSEIAYAGREGKRIVYCYEPLPEEYSSAPLTHSLLVASVVRL